MNLEKFKPTFALFTLGVIAFIIHKLLFYFFIPKGYEAAFVYSIALLYLFYFFFSSILILVLDKVKQNNMNSIGYVFLLLTTFKMGIAYLLARPILAGNLPKTPTEKISFFVIFIYFLTIETYVTIRILNNKQ
jgi:hypothetical protein